MIINVSAFDMTSLEAALYNANLIDAMGDPSEFAVDAQHQLAIVVWSASGLVELGQLMTAWAIERDFPREVAANASVAWRPIHGTFLATFPGVQFRIA